MRVLQGTKIPIAGIAGDQQAALFGQACFEAGDGKEHLRDRLLPADEHGRRPPASSKNGLLTTIAVGAGRNRSQYALEGSVFVGGAVIQWLRDEMRFFNEQRRQRNITPQKVPDTGGRVPGAGLHRSRRALLGYVCARLRSSGSRAGTGREHIIRAALESIAYQSLDLVEAMETGHRPAGSRDAAGGRRREPRPAS